MLPRTSQHCAPRLFPNKGILSVEGLIGLFIWELWETENQANRHTSSTYAGLTPGLTPT